MFDDVPISQEYALVYLKQSDIFQRKRKRNEDQTLSSAQLYPSDPEEEPVEKQTSAEEAEEGSTLKHEAEQGALQRVDEKQILEGSATVPAPTITTRREKEEEPSILPTGSPDRYGLHYYLVKPRTSGSQRVLIALSPTATFLSCLQDQTVLEFPTIQVLSYHQDALPTGYVTETRYLTGFKQEAHEMEQLLAGSDDSENEPTKTKGFEPNNSIPNPSSLLATLERDIKS